MIIQPNIQILSMNVLFEIYTAFDQKYILVTTILLLVLRYTEENIDVKINYGKIYWKN